MSDQEGRDATRPSLDRGRVWSLLGAPTEQLGSVNDPRTHEEQGHEWNEKWIYLDPESGEVVRVVLWNRYDLLGSFVVKPDGSYQPETIG